MAAPEEDPAEIERAYRRALFKSFGLPPAFLTIVLVLALVLFSPEIFRFMVLRAKVQRIRAQD
ncbi:MAG: hypothetical protein RL479_1967 [Verrucomicrobiota bacterium]